MAERRREERAAAAAAEEEARLERERTGGVVWAAELVPVPTTGDGERITLPPSVLEALTAQNALDLSGPGNPITFELVALDDSQQQSGAAPLSSSAAAAAAAAAADPFSSSSVVARTHAGVAEFTAAEGTVGVPPQTALTLAKERGVQAFSQKGGGGGGLRLRVKFVRLQSFPKSSCACSREEGSTSRAPTW